MFKGKKYVDSAKLIDRSVQYEVADAMDLVVKTAKAKFDETSFTGVVDMVDIEKNKVRVIVSMFGRETPVELELDQVELVSE